MVKILGNECAPDPKKLQAAFFAGGIVRLVSSISYIYSHSLSSSNQSLFFSSVVFFHKEKGKVTKLYSLNSINFRTSYGIVQSYFCLHPAFLPHPQRFLWYKISFCLVKSTPHFQYNPQLASYAKRLKVLCFFLHQSNPKMPKAVL